MSEQQTPYFYDAFGLTIASDVLMDELRPTEAVDRPDLRILLGKIGRPRPTFEEGNIMDFEDPDGVMMAWPTVAGFRFKDGHTIIVEPYPDVEERFLAFPILGPVMAWVLNGRGLFVLHASAVDIEGRTLAFMGDKLAGKSTTAAAFIRAGYPLITDDLLAVELRKDGASRILPAFAQLKLAEDAAASVRIDGARALPLVHKDFPKRQHKLTEMRSEPASIDWFVELSRGGETPALEKHGLAEAIRALNRFSYLPRFDRADWSDADQAAHFRNCAGLANIAKVGRLHVPHDLERLDETVALMVRTLTETAE